jgi:aryl sulfotransferase
MISILGYWGSIMLVESARREYRTWSVDSRRWNEYRPRADDILIATYPKCGTTWAQRIVSLLVFQTTDAKPIFEISAWVDQRFAQPIQDVIVRIEAQPHRRFLKSHLPLDGLPFYDEVKYIHVARDGRDACMSLHNHMAGFVDEAIGRLSKAGLDDELIARPFPPVPDDPARFFHRWITEGVAQGHEDGMPNLSFFQFERAWWEARSRPNVLLVHYNDLKSDLPGEMQRIADFLEIEVAPAVLGEFVEAAGFEAMSRDGDALMARAAAGWRDGSRTFFNKGTNGRWRDVVSEADLALYDAKVKAMLSPECALWVAEGRHGGDPRQA